MQKPAPYVADTTADGSDPLEVAVKLQIKQTATQYAQLDIANMVELLLEEGVLITDDQIQSIGSKMIEKKYEQLWTAHTRKQAEAKGEAPVVRLPEAVRLRLEAARASQATPIA